MEANYTNKARLDLKRTQTLPTIENEGTNSTAIRKSRPKSFWVKTGTN
jgi:hypothetical protein